MNKLEENRLALYKKKDKKKGLSHEQAAASHRSVFLLDGMRSQSNEPHTFIDSQLMILLTQDNFGAELAEVPEHIQFAAHMIMTELPDANISIATAGKPGVELNVTDPETKKTFIVIIVSSAAEKDEVVRNRAPRKLSLSQAKVHLQKEKIIVLVSPPRASFEKIRRGFSAEYQNLKKNI